METKHCRRVYKIELTLELQESNKLFNASLKMGFGLPFIDEGQKGFFYSSDTGLFGNLRDLSKIDGAMEAVESVFNFKLNGEEEKFAKKEQSFLIGKFAIVIKRDAGSQEINKTNLSVEQATEIFQEVKTDFITEVRNCSSSRSCVLF